MFVMKHLRWSWTLLEVFRLSQIAKLPTVDHYRLQLCRKFIRTISVIYLVIWLSLWQMESKNWSHWSEPRPLLLNYINEVQIYPIKGFLQSVNWSAGWKSTKHVLNKIWLYAGQNITIYFLCKMWKPVLSNKQFISMIMKWNSEKSVLCSLWRKVCIRS